MSKQIDYGDIVSSVLTDRSGNGHRLEAMARLTQAMLYFEAAKALADTAARGFPISLLSDGESFFLLVAGPAQGPAVSFERKEGRLVETAVRVPSAALETKEPQREWTPGKLTHARLKQEIRDIMTESVKALSRSSALEKI